MSFYSNGIFFCFLRNFNILGGSWEDLFSYGYYTEVVTEIYTEMVTETTVQPRKHHKKDKHHKDRKDHEKGKHHNKRYALYGSFFIFS